MTDSFLLADLSATETVMGPTAEELLLLASVEEAWATLATAASSDPASLEALLVQVFGSSDATLIDLLASGSGLEGLNFAVASAEEMNGALGAYAVVGADGTETIYLSETLLSSGDSAAILAVLLEEIGHALDTRLNGDLDTLGDEGELFAQLVLGNELSDVQLAAIQADVDSATLTIDGVQVGVELDNSTSVSNLSYVVDQNGNLIIAGNLNYIGTANGNEPNLAVSYDASPDVNADVVLVGFTNLATEVAGVMQFTATFSAQQLVSGTTYSITFNDQDAADLISSYLYEFTGAPATNTSGSVVEAGGVNNLSQPSGTSGVASADADDSGSGWSAVSVSANSLNGYGSYILTSAGVWTYTLDNNNLGVQSLKIGEILSDSFTISRNNGNSVTVSITITGTNDTPTVAAALSDSADEGDASFTVDLLDGASDVDAGETATLTVASVSYSVDGGTASSTAPAGFSITGGVLTVNPTNAAFNSLAVGDEQVVVVTYDVTDAQGATVAQTATITITGTNDTPTVAAALSDSADEGDASFTVDLLDGASDVDAGETATLTVASVSYSVDGGTASSTAPAGFSITGGVLTVNPTNAAFNSLAVGDEQVVVVTYDVTDAQGATVAQTATITITGTNDTPTVAAALSDSADEGDASFTVDLLDGASDVDAGETATLTVASVSYSVDGGTASSTAPAGFSITGGVLTVNPTNAAFNSLAVGDEQVVVVTYDVTDAQGATVAQTATITITGTNDTPTVAAALSDSADEGDASFTVDLLDGASDVDAGETATLTVASVSYSVDGGTASSTAPAGFSITGGVLTVNPTNAAFNSLAVGDEQVVVVTYDVTDAQGATVAQTATITITGTNDTPTVAAALSDSADEGDASFTVDLLDGASDVDAGETATLTVASVSYSVDGGTASSTAPAGFSITGGVLTVNPTNAAFNSLAVGDEQVVVVTYDVTDAQGATVAQTATITITGTNDTPTVAAALSDSADEGDASFTVDLLDGASDVDAGETATLTVASVSYSVDGGTASSTAPAGFSITGGVLTVNPTNAAFNSLAVGDEQVVVVTYDVTDAQGATVAQTATITITGTNDTPTVAAALSDSADEGDASFTVDLLDGASDVDAGETATLTVASVSYSVDGGTASSTAPAGFSITGGVLTVNPTNAAFNSLAVGDEQVVVVTYDVTDAQGATVAQTATITITGTNDTPTVAAALSDSADEGDASFTVDLLDGASDVDAGETATLTVASVSYSVDGGTASSTAPAGFSITGGVLTVNPTNAAFNSLAVGDEQVVVVTYDVTDAQGATVAQTATITITGTNDTPTVAAALSDSADEGDASFTVDLLDGASDVDAGETATLTVASVSYSVDGGTASSTAPAGFSITGGVLTVNPTNAAFNSLAVGDEQVVVVTYDVTDAQGATVAQTATITITGTNDTPTVAAALSDSADEGDASFTVDLLDGASDVDAGETATLTVASVSYSVDGGTASSTAPAGFSITGGVLTVNPTNAAFNSLAVGDEQVVVVTYDVTDAQGATVAQTATITITGTNDTPTVAAALSDSADEGDASFTVDLLDGASDVDAGETATLTVASVSYSVDGGTASSTAPAGFSITGGVLTVNPTNAAFNSLAVGDEQVVVVTYDVTDAQGATVAQTATITITGTNDTPTVAAALSDSADEGDASFTVDLLDGASDVDAGETATLTVASVSYSVDGGTASSTAPAGFSITGGVLTVNPTNAAFNSLAVGDEQVVVVTYDVTDAQGATVAQTATITITGTNDTPTVAAALSDSADEGDASFTVDLLDGASDVDAGETATLTVASVSYSVDGGTASSTAPAGFSITGGVLTVNPTNAAFNSLAVGDEQVVVVTYDVTDAQGATVAQTATITITGTNDTPTVAAALSDSADEGDASFTVDLLDGASDVDAGETATLTVASVSYSVDGGTASSTAPAGFSITGGVLTVNPTNAAFNSLAVGDEQVVVVTYDVTDAQGATVAQTATITITGTNDVPTVESVPTDPTIALLKNAEFDLFKSLEFADVDQGDILDYSYVVKDVNGMELEELIDYEVRNGLISFKDAGFYRVSVTATDSEGASVTYDAYEFSVMEPVRFGNGDLDQIDFSSAVGQQFRLIWTPFLAADGTMKYKLSATNSGNFALGVAVDSTISRGFVVDLPELASGVGGFQLRDGSSISVYQSVAYDELGGLVYEGEPLVLSAGQFSYNSETSQVTIQPDAWANFNQDADSLVYFVFKLEFEIAAAYASGISATTDLVQNSQTSETEFDAFLGTVQVVDDLEALSFNVAYVDNGNLQADELIGGSTVYADNEFKNARSFNGILDKDAFEDLISNYGVNIARLSIGLRRGAELKTSATVFDLDPKLTGTQTSVAIDEDGWFMSNYVHSGSTATYTAGVTVSSFNQAFGGVQSAGYIDFMKAHGLTTTTLDRDSDGLVDFTETQFDWGGKVKMVTQLISSDLA